MGFAGRIGKYQLGRTIGEGTFAKVKIAKNTLTGQTVAVKIIDKHKSMENKLTNQIKREIGAMKLLHHPNIVRIHEVIGTKTKIYIIMEYVSGGSLSDKLAYLKKLSEKEARKYFQQLIDAVDYCHERGVYHRDLKPENLLLDAEGNLKISDFGLSILRKPGDLLSTVCGSPSYVAPEVIANKNYDGSPADIWSCGVILFELLTGRLPFEDRNIINLYRKICKAEYNYPEWVTGAQKNLIDRILELSPTQRIIVSEILENDWFKEDFSPSIAIESEEQIDFDDINTTFSNNNKNDPEEARSPRFINAFQLIAMSNDLDFSRLFEGQEGENHKTKLGSEHSINETIEKIEVAAKDVSLSVERMNNSKVKLSQSRQLLKSRTNITVSVNVIEVTPSHCVVELSRSAGELRVYKEFCRSLSSELLKERSQNLDESRVTLVMDVDQNDNRKLCS